VIDWTDLLPRTPENEADYAAMRVLGRTTVGKTFSLQFGSTRDRGAPARTAWRIISEDADHPPSEHGEEEEWTLHESAKGRVQVKARIIRDRGRVAELRFERVTGRANRNATIETLLTLDEAAARRLTDLCFALKGIDPSGTETLKLDDDLLAAVIADPAALAAAYERDPDGFAAMIRSDVSAEDVIAIAARREALREFEALLAHSAEAQIQGQPATREAAWQRFFEENPWVLGVGLSGHFFTSWDADKLERAVAGSNIADVGKRVDAVLTTSGLIRSLVLAEIKLPEHPLLERDPYRSGCYAPSRELSGGVAQAHTTAERARDDLGDWIAARDDAGFYTGEQIYSGSPRSYLVIGRLTSMTHEGSLHPDKVRSFELFRRHLSFPEVLTYDEVLARAKWSLDLLEQDEPQVS
jgi:hypothetical protein